MQVIIYKFVDGTTNTVEVTEEIYLIHLELLQQEKRNHWRETRRHTSLYYLIENGIDFEDKSADTLAIIIRRDNTERVHKALLTELMTLLQNCDCYDHKIENFAKKCNLSSSRLSHLFCEQIGVPLKSYILFHQLEKAFTELLQGSNVTDAAMLAGFNSPSHFAATVKKWMGLTVSAAFKDSGFLKVFI